MHGRQRAAGKQICVQHATPGTPAMTRLVSGCSACHQYICGLVVRWKADVLVRLVLVTDMTSI